MSKRSREYATLIKETNRLVVVVKNNITPLSGNLVACGLITTDQQDRLRNVSRDENERAADLVKLVRDKVELNPENYHKFVKILTEDESTYKDVLYMLRIPVESEAMESTPVKVQNLNGPGLGVKQEPKRPDSLNLQVSHTPGVSSEQRQSEHHASCSCTICNSHFGCPNPLPVEVTFPLLEDIKGLDGQQKEELKELLKESTKNIMKEFYFLLSSFFESLKRRNIALEDLKTHLMILNAYSGDSKEQQSLFQDQKDKLKRASTINAVFDILQGFWSFVNYDLVEDLINIVGSPNDKEGLKNYKEKFAEYARRRICECPSKLAASTDAQCDVYVKVESRFEKLTLDDLCAFRKNIGELLQLSRRAIRLCCIEKGCIKLTFQIPQFVVERVHSLISQQRGELTKLGIRQLTCGSTLYVFFEGSTITGESSYSASSITTGATATVTHVEVSQYEGKICITEAESSLGRSCRSLLVIQPLSLAPYQFHTREDRKCEVEVVEESQQNNSQSRSLLSLTVGNSLLRRQEAKIAILEEKNHNLMTELIFLRKKNLELEARLAGRDVSLELTYDELQRMNQSRPDLESDVTSVDEVTGQEPTLAEVLLACDPIED